MIPMTTKSFSQDFSGDMKIRFLPIDGFQGISKALNEILLPRLTMQPVTFYAKQNE